MMQEPIVLTDVFDEERRQRVIRDADRLLINRSYSYDSWAKRIISNDERLYLHLEALLPLARTVFNDSTILPSYACWAKYSEPGANLQPHKDRNACTYTIDYCVRQTRSWPLFVDGRSYSLEENEALAFMGEDQEHWRGAFSPGNTVEMIFFHFVRPDHWYFNPDKERPEGFRM